MDTHGSHYIIWSPYPLRIGCDYFQPPLRFFIYPQFTIISSGLEREINEVKILLSTYVTICKLITNMLHFPIPQPTWCTSLYQLLANGHNNNVVFIHCTRTF